MKPNLKKWCGVYLLLQTFILCNNHLLFRGNNLLESDAIGLRYALFHMPNLEVLDISDNFIGSDGIRSSIILFTGIYFWAYGCTIWQVDIKCCRGLLPYFIEASEKGYPFAELHVENCELCEVGVIDLVSVLATLKRPLKSLSIANNVVGRWVWPPFEKLLLLFISKGVPGLQFPFLQQSSSSTGKIFVNINSST